MNDQTSQSFVRPRAGRPVSRLRPIHLLGVIVALCAALDAHAQTSVTIGGFLDIGGALYSNNGGSKFPKIQDSGLLPTKLFFRGREDLGDGAYAAFSLESLFDMSTGGIDPQSHGNLFEDSAWLGIGKKGLGELRAGQQNDFAFDDFLLTGIDPSTGFAGGLLNFRTGSFGSDLTGLRSPPQIGGALAVGVPLNFAPIITAGVPTGLSAINWDRAAGTRMSNAVKFTSANFAGFSAGVMYSLGEVSGEFSHDTGKSASLKYDSEQLRAAVVYTEENYAVINGGKSGMSNLLAGARTRIGGFDMSAMYSNARNLFTGAKIQSVQTGVCHEIAPQLTLGAAYTYERGNSLLKNVIVNQFALQLTHPFSKRTSVYLAGVYQHTNGAYVADIANIVSSTPKMSVGELGFIHRF